MARSDNGRLFLRTYSDRVTLLHIGSQDLAPAAAMAFKNIEVIRIALTDLRADGEFIVTLRSDRKTL
jgi:hypothetical protein